MRLAVYVGSLVEPAVGANAVVNASNPAVALGSGVSGALRQACGGAAFQAELRERLDEDFDGALEPDDCLVTSAGTSTAFRWTLHVPAVDYRVPDPETGGPSGPSRVRACVRALLDAAAALAAENDLGGRFVLATPLLGAGAGGLGPIVSLDAMMGSVRKFLRAASPVERDAVAELVFVVLDANVARLVALAAEKHGLVIEQRERDT